MQKDCNPITSAESDSLINVILVEFTVVYPFARCIHDFNHSSYEIDWVDIKDCYLGPGFNCLTDMNGWSS
jgi:hypothetical protein